MQIPGHPPWEGGPLRTPRPLRTPLGGHPSAPEIPRDVVQGGGWWGEDILEQLFGKAPPPGGGVPRKWDLDVFGATLNISFGEGDGSIAGGPGRQTLSTGPGHQTLSPGPGYQTLPPGPGHQTLSRWWGASLLGRSCGGRGGHKKKKAPGHRVRGRAPDMPPAYIKLNSDLSESGRSGLQLNISFGEGVGSIAGDPGGGRDGSNKDLPQNTFSPLWGGGTNKYHPKCPRTMWVAL